MRPGSLDRQPRSADAIKVKVERGWVNALRQVASWSQKKPYGRCREADGARWSSNMITIRPAVMPETSKRESKMR